MNGGGVVGSVESVWEGGVRKRIVLRRIGSGWLWWWSWKFVSDFIDFWLLCFVLNDFRVMGKVGMVYFGLVVWCVFGV